MNLGGVTMLVHTPTHQTSLTYNHQGELKAALDRLAVDLVGQVGEADITLQLLSGLRSILPVAFLLLLFLFLHFHLYLLLLRLHSLALVAKARAGVELYGRGRVSGVTEEGVPLGRIYLKHPQNISLTRVD